MSSAPAATRSLRERPLGRVAIVVGVLLLALVVSRACTGRGSEISEEEAVAIARREVTYQPDRTMVRFVRRGAPRARPFWAVSLSTLDSEGKLDRVTVVLVDARTRAVTEVRVTDR
jgi:hypothetical protein